MSGKNLSLDPLDPNRKVLSPEEKLRYALETTMSADDPAYWMLFDGYESVPKKGIYRDDCYICRDPDFARMGLPLCYECSRCGGHVPADDTVCSDCGFDQVPIEGEVENEDEERSTPWVSHWSHHRHCDLCGVGMGVRQFGYW